MAQVCMVGSPVQSTSAMDALSVKVGILLSDEKLFGADLLAEARKPENWNKSNMFYFQYLTNGFKQYLSGSCDITYSSLKSFVQKWNGSEFHSEPMNVALRDNLVKILSEMNDPELKDRAILLLSLIRNNTPDIKLAKAAEPAKPVMLPDAAPREALPPVARPEPSTGKVGEWMSDQAIFSKHMDKWTPEAKYGRFFTLYKMIETLRSYLDGKATDTELQARAKAWQKNDCFKDTLSKIVQITLFFQLGSSLPETLDASVRARAEKAAKLIPLLSSEKEEATPAPAPAAEAKPADSKGEAGKVLEALSDAAVLGDKLSAYSSPADKYGKYYPLYKMLETIRAYVRGDKDISYSVVKQKMEAWSTSEAYKDEVSQRVRSQLISILGIQKANVSDTALQNKIDTLLLLVNRTPVVSTPAPIAERPAEAPKAEPAVAAPPPVAEVSVPKGEVKGNKVLVADYTVQPTDDLKYDRSTTDTNKQRVDVAVLEHARFLAEKKNSFYFRAVVTLKVDSRGQVNEVNFSQVEAERYGKSGPAVTLEEVGQFMTALASVYRREMAFPRGPKVSGEEKFTLLLNPAGAPQRKLPKEMMVDFEAAPAAEKAPPADPVESVYTVDLTPMDAPTGTVVSRDALGSELTRLAKAGGLAYAKEAGSDFVIKALPSFEFDKDGYLAKVSFDQVSVESGIDTGTKMKAALAYIAGEWRNIRFEPNVKFSLGNKPSVFTGH